MKILNIIQRKFVFGRSFLCCNNSSWKWIFFHLKVCLFPFQMVPSLWGTSIRGMRSACLLVQKQTNKQTPESYVTITLRSGQRIAVILRTSLIYSIKLQEHVPRRQTGGRLFKASAELVRSYFGGNSYKRGCLLVVKCFVFQLKKILRVCSLFKRVFTARQRCTRSRANYVLSWSANDNGPEFTAPRLLRCLRCTLAEVKKCQGLVQTVGCLLKIRQDTELCWNKLVFGWDCLRNRLMEKGKRRNKESVF